MTQEEKRLLTIDLSARVPYEIMVKVNDTQGIMDEIDIPNERIFVSGLNPFLYGGAKASWFTVNGDKIYPYLRSLSSMTEKEQEELFKIDGKRVIFSSRHLTWHLDGEVTDYLNKKMFDWRGLIPKGLALPALEGMYNVK